MLSLKMEAVVLALKMEAVALAPEVADQLSAAAMQLSALQPWRTRKSIMLLTHCWARVDKNAKGDNPATHSVMRVGSNNNQHVPELVTVKLGRQKRGEER